MNAQFEKANICTCNQCNNIFIDQNPQVGAKVYNVNLSKITDLQYIKESTEAENDNEYFWGCPICETDSFLSDEIDEVRAKKSGIIE